MPLNLTDLWPLANEARVALQKHYGPPTDRAAERAGIPFGAWYGWLMAARIFEPEPISTARLHVRAAYTSPARLEAALLQGVQLGLLRSGGKNEYWLTDAGHIAVRQLVAAAYEAMAPLQPLPQAEVERLVVLLRRLVAASLDAPEPPGKWCLRIARHFDPWGAAGPVAQLDQYLSDLDSYRDDARLAVWRPYGVSGQAWEAFTTLWRGAAVTVDDLCAVLAPRRGFSQAGYALALDELTALGWVVEERGMYRVSATGRALRAEAEEATARGFYAPWACLGQGELAELAGLLARLRDALA